jgi:hypothetical protein
LPRAGSGRSRKKTTLAAHWRIPAGGQSLRPAQRQPTANYRPAHNEIDRRLTQVPLPESVPLPEPVLPDP